MSEQKTIREAARNRQPLDGADAQALEGALCQLERELAECRASLEVAEGACSNHLPAIAIAAKLKLDTERELSEARGTMSDVHSSILAALILLPQDCNGRELIEDAVRKLNESLGYSATNKGGAG